MSLREFVYQSIINDATLNGLGIEEANTFPNFAPDSPSTDLARFLVLRWTTTGPPLGRDTTAHSSDLQIWAYERQPDFDNIMKILRRCQGIMREVEGQDHGSGWVIGVVDNGGSEDLPASEYGRETVAKNWGFTIQSSEEG